jgi:outer membrane murein-binding lipoprotein Lpp
MRRVSFILATVLVAAISLSSCVSDETNNDSISEDSSSPNGKENMLSSDVEDDEQIRDPYFVDKSEAVTSSTNARSPENGNFVISVNGKKIEVYKYDYKEMENYFNTKAVVSKKGNGWRLPNVEELKAMCQSLYHKGKGNFKRFGIYWSNEQECNICPVWVVEFKPVPYHDTGRRSHTDYAYIRMVRDLD